MLIQFSVANFRSIREEQTFSMVRNAAKELPHNYFDSKSPSVPDLLKSAVIYGANAAGKSNILKSLFSMRMIIKNSFNKKLDEEIDVHPFLLDPIASIKPTTFSIVFIAPLFDDGIKKHVRVDYSFSADKNRIYEESLSVYPKGREQAWFHRIYNQETDEYDWIKDSDFFKGQKATWKKNTRSDQLFLSAAVHLNSDQLKPIYNAIIDNIIVIGDDRIGSSISKEICKNSTKGKRNILHLLQQCDVDVEDIVLEKPKRKLQFPDEFPEELKKQILENYSKHLDVFFVHLDKQGNRIKINIDDESDGTQKIFEFSSLIFDAISNNKTLVIDEFNKSLHPDLIRFLVKVFNSKNNPNGGQLVITTHETSILRQDLLRRDQIWFCERNRNKETVLFPLTDFSPRKGREDIEESYLHGRYGGKPIIQDFNFTSDKN